MIILNTTFCVEHEIEIKWLQWLKEKHIVEILESGRLKNPRLAKLISHQQAGSENYTLQLEFNNKTILDLFYIENLAESEEEMLSLFGEKVLIFRSEMELIQDFVHG